MNKKALILVYLLLPILIFAFPRTTKTTVKIGVYQEAYSAINSVVESEDFKTTFPDINVILEVKDFLSFHNDLISKPSLNDIEVINGLYLQQIYDKNRLLALGISRNDDFALSSAALEFSKISSTRFKGIPFAVSPSVMYYRFSDFPDSQNTNQLFSSWNDFISSGYEFMFGMPFDETQESTAFLRRNERAFVNNPYETSLYMVERNQTGWQSPLNGELFSPSGFYENVLDQVRKIRTFGLDANTVKWTGSWLRQFSNDIPALEFDTSDFVHFLKTRYPLDQDSGWRVSLLPGGDSFSGGDHFLTISRSVSYSKRSVLFDIIRYICGTETAQLLCYTEGGLFPALTSVYDSPEINQPDPFFGQQNIGQIFGESQNKIYRVQGDSADARARDLWHSAVSLANTTSLSSREIIEQIKGAL